MATGPRDQPHEHPFTGLEAAAAGVVLTGVMKLLDESDPDDGPTAS